MIRRATGVALRVRQAASRIGVLCFYPTGLTQVWPRRLRSAMAASGTYSLTVGTQPARETQSARVRWARVRRAGFESS